MSVFSIFRVAALAVKQLVELCESHTKGPVASGVHGYKPLNTCTICERSFRGNSYLKLHMRSHTGEFGILVATEVCGCLGNGWSTI